MKSKQDIRKEIAAKRKALDSQWLNSASAQVVENFQQMTTFQPAGTIALYMATDGEVNPDTLLSRCWVLGKRTCIPVFNAVTEGYEMAEISKATPFRTGHHGIQEPISPSIIPMDQIDLIAVPGVAFDLQGNRLGRGGGHYDRLLEGYCGCTAALAFDFQLFGRIPVDSHDQPLQCIVTETKTFNI